MEDRLADDLGAMPRRGDSATALYAVADVWVNVAWLGEFSDDEALLP